MTPRDTKKTAKYLRLTGAALTVILLFLFLPGCADSVDINEKLIATSLAFDVKDGKIWFYSEIANIETGKTSESSGSQKNKYIVIKGYGDTLIEARDNLDTQFEKPLYLSGAIALIFTENFAKEYLLEYLYRFKVDETYRKKGLTVITREDPEELFKGAHEESNAVGLLVEGIIETLEARGKTFTRTTARLLENLSSDYTGFLIPCIGLRHGVVALTGYSVLNGPTIDGFIPSEEAIGTVYLKGKMTKFNFRIPYNNINFTIEVKLNNRIVKPSYKNGRASFDVKMKCKAEILYGDIKTPYNLEKKAFKELTEIVRNMLKEEFMRAIERAQTEFECDYLEFDDEFRTRYPAVFEKIDWRQTFISAEVNMEVEVKLSSRWGVGVTARMNLGEVS
jgi:germination protein, Ger(x)C family